MPNIIPNNQCVEVVAQGTNVVVGWGWGEQLGAAQKQRWLLRGFQTAANWPPTRPVFFRSPPQDPTFGNPTTLAAFKTRVQATFNPATDLYGLANCLTTSGKPIPTPIPPPAHPSPATGTPFPIFSQGDVGVSQIRTGDGTNRVVGYLFTLRYSGNGSRSTEHWGLLPAYALSTLPTLREINSGDEVARLLDGSSWSSTASFVVAACSYFSTLPSTADM